MNTTKKIALGVVGGAIAVAGPLGVVVAAQAATTPSPVASSTAPAWPGGPGMGMGMGGRSGRGSMANGTGYAGYGVSEMAEHLAEKLGVSSDAVATALRQYQVETPMTERGRDLTDAEMDARHGDMAAYLATALKVDAAEVEAALESFQADRQAAMTAQLTERLDDMVAAGTLTRVQADAILAAHEAGQAMMLGGRGGGRWG